MLRPRTALMVLLGLVALTNGLIGLLGVLPIVPVSRLATAFYSASLSVDPQVQHLTEMFGAYMVAVGVMAGLAAFRPERHRGITLVISALLVLRSIQRILFASEQADVYGISPGYYWAQTLAFLAVGLALALLAPITQRGGEGRTPAAA